MNGLGWRRLLVPVSLAAAILAAAPFLGLARDALLARFPERADTGRV